MKLITIRSQIKSVATRWRLQYGLDKVYSQLSKLNLNTATSEDIANIIGDNTWACNKQCGECGKYGNAIVEVGEEFDYESSTAWLCLSCAEKAYLLIKNQTEK